MKIRLLTAIVLGFLGLTVQANSATAVYLVGVRHVYSIPSYPDAHQSDRQQIEEDYAAAVAEAQKHYDADMASIHDEEAKDSGNIHQVDRDAVQENLEKDVAEASDRREGALGEIYPICDSVRASHPEFKVDQDGPYKVIEVETAPTGDYEHVVYYLPYPAYIEPCPYGWVWGEPYPYLAWGVQIRLFHSMWITFGCPFYEPMYYGGGVFVFSAPIRSEVIVNRGGWNNGRPPHLTQGERSVLYSNYDVQRKSGYFDKGPGGRPLTEFKRPDPSVKPGSRYTNSDGVSKYSESSSTTKATGVSRYKRTLGSGTSSPTGTSRYSHSATGSASSGSTSSTSVSRYGHGGTSTSTAGTQSTTSKYVRSGGSTTSTSSHPTSGSSTSGSGGHGSSGSASSGGSTGHSSGGSGSSGEPPKKKG